MDNSFILNIVSICMMINPSDEDNIIDNMMNKKGFIQNMRSHFITQKLNVPQLFRAGVRYFHVHIEYDDGKIYVTNVLQSGLFSGYVKQLVEVMEENPGEIVILHIEKTLFNDSIIAQSKFDDMVHGYFNHLYKSNTLDNAGSIKISDVWEINAKLIVLYPRKTDKFWSAKESIQATNLGININYDTFKDNIKSVYKYELLKVVIASRSFKYSEYLDIIIKKNNSIDLYRHIINMIEINELREEIFDNDKLFIGNNLTSTILSINFADIVSSKSMINYNEKYDL